MEETQYQGIRESAPEKHTEQSPCAYPLRTTEQACNVNFESVSFLIQTHTIYAYAIIVEQSLCTAVISSSNGVIKTEIPSITIKSLQMSVF